MLPIILCLLVSLFATVADAATISRPSKSFGGTSFINGVVPQASDFNGDPDTIYSEFNGDDYLLDCVIEAFNTLK